MQWTVAELQGKNLKYSIRKLYLVVVVYHLWMQRNALIQGRTPKTEELANFS
jgi:hypothetical protein